VKTGHAFCALYEEHFEFVHRMARRFGVQEHCLEDATQDLFVVVHRRLETFEGRSSMKSWLYGITRRIAKDYRRRTQRKEQGKVSFENVKEVLPCGGQQPHAQLERSQAAWLLEYMLSSIEASRREVFVLAEIEEMSAPEIAKTLSLNVNTVYSRLRSARIAFEKAVARHQARATALEERVA
jgi:RNA polymerase sigma-70 factor (ECF subfamily)